MQIPCKCDPKFFLLPVKKKFEKPQYNVLKSKLESAGFISLATFEERHMKERTYFKRSYLFVHYYPYIFVRTPLVIMRSAIEDLQVDISKSFFSSI